MLVVGLTGGIGSGKSTFAALLMERGAQVIDADELGRQALRPGHVGWKKVVSQFGDEVLIPGTQEIDRKRLAAIVFSDPSKLAALNAIVHPLILQGMADNLERLRNADGVVIVDAALIFEAGLDKAVDLIVAVLTDDQLRGERVIRSRGMSYDEFNARARAQLSSEEIAERSDIVVHNDGDLAALAAEAERVWNELVKRQ